MFRWRAARMAPTSPEKNESPVPTVSSTNGPRSLPEANRATHAPKQTPLMARRVIFQGERYVRHSECCFAVVFMVRARCH